MPGITPRINGGYLGKSIRGPNTFVGAGSLSATSHLILTKDFVIPNVNEGTVYSVEAICVGGGGGAGGHDSEPGGGGGSGVGYFLRGLPGFSVC